VSNRVFALGFSLGGTLALETSANGWAAVACFYPDLPRNETVLRGACPVFARFGREDLSLSNAASLLEASLMRYRVPRDVGEEDTAGHSYMSPGESAPWPIRPFTRSRGIRPDAEAADRAWTDLEAFLASVAPATPEPDQRQRRSGIGRIDRWWRSLRGRR